MKDLIKALQLIYEHSDDDFASPTMCEHDCFYVRANTDEFPDFVVDELSELGFEEGDECFYSYRFGSA